MKRQGLIIYGSLLTYIIVMSVFIFRGLGKISAEIKLVDLLNNVAPLIQSYYILLVIFIFILFISVLALLLLEINKSVKQAKEEKNVNVREEVQENTEEDQQEIENNQQKEEQQNLKYKKISEELVLCLDETLKSIPKTDTKLISEKVLHCISKFYEITQGEIFIRKHNENQEDKLVLSSTFAFFIPEEKVYEFELGEGLIGQVAKAGESLYMDQLPEGYITVKSGLGSATPSHLLISPWKNKEDKTFAIIEIASFKPFNKQDIKIIEEISEKLMEYYQ